MHDSKPSPTLFERTGVAYFPLALVARLPFAMMVVGVLTLVVSARESLQLGGLSSAVVGIGSAIVGPFIGAAADRYGQRIALLIAAVTHSAALVGLAFIAYSAAPDWAMLAVAFAVGATSPQTSPMSRSRLVLIIQNFLPTERRPKVMSQVLAYESAADEVVFVFGPVIVGVLATFFGPRTPILAAAALTLLFIIAFALHHTSAPAKSAAERAETLAPASELARPSLLVVVAGITGVGMVFGSTLTALTAFMQAQGQPEAAGLFYGIMGIGSAILAISVSLFSPKFTLRYRWLVFALFVLTGEAFLAGAASATQIAIGLAITGIGIGPLLVTLYSLGTARSPEGRSATVMTMLGSGVILGQSLSSAVGGSIAENVGVSAALVLPLYAAVFIAVAGALNWILTPSGTGRDV
ncbi:putative MFS family arabinose efflux permease [Leucobacter komagatae]|uniref:Putative MFS family arabinose efflux permease n=1 Tax=Leucobacter komagatae TaxID=55969 RepID=A0A542XXZ4_9MICO|nr:MFS transporter [Leucobacter komagatae]TQL40688.1 putative MFS family arabinose efflux permease [Leucobacter komagatae]